MVGDRPDGAAAERLTADDRRTATPARAPAAARHRPERRAPIRPASSRRPRWRGRRPRSRQVPRTLERQHRRGGPRPVEAGQPAGRRSARLHERARRAPRVPGLGVRRERLRRLRRRDRGSGRAPAVRRSTTPGRGAVPVHTLERLTARVRHWSREQPVTGAHRAACACTRDDAHVVVTRPGVRDGWATARRDRSYASRAGCRVSRRWYRTRAPGPEPATGWLATRRAHPVTGWVRTRTGPSRRATRVAVPAVDTGRRPSAPLVRLTAAASVAEAR